jgi:hypothetical protein
MVKKRTRRSLGQQIGGSVVGLLAGAIGVGMVITAAFVLVSSRMVGVVDGILTGLAMGIAVRQVRDLRGAVASGATITIIAGLFGGVMFGLSKDMVVPLSLRTLGFAAAMVLVAGLGAVAAGSRQKRLLNFGAGIIVGTLLVGTLGILVFGMLSILPTDIGKTLQFAGFFATVLFALFYMLTSRIGGTWAGIIAGALPCAGGWIVSLVLIHNEPLWPALLLSLAGTVLGLTAVWWRPLLLYPFLAAWNTLLYWSDDRRQGDRPSLLRWNSAFWDEHQRLPLFGLEEHLVLVAERNPVEGQAALRYLSPTRQRWAARAALIELEARRLERCTDVEMIAQARHQLSTESLSGSANLLLGRLGRVSQDLSSALNQVTVYHQRLLLRNTIDHLSGLLDELTRSSEPNAERFYRVAVRWHEVISTHIAKLTNDIQFRQEIDNPYIFGVPLTDQHAIFVGRGDIATRIEQLLLDQRRPPLLLHGQRRMGKTSLLRNLGRLLPSTMVPLFVDGEGIAGAVDYTDLLYCIAREMIKSAREHHLTLPPLRREEIAPSPFTRFSEWLDQIEQALEDQGYEVVLLALDEFEALDSVFGKERFDEYDFLRLLRHLIQHQPRFKVLLSGSHLFDEYQRWASYLVNVQVVKVGYLEEDEARQLIELPVKDYALRYEPEASQRVLDLTRGHPHLLQLLCYEVVELKNDQPLPERWLVRIKDVEAAVPRALDTGRFFFVDIEHNQVDSVGASLLRFLASYGENGSVSQDTLVQHFSEGLEQALNLLLQRDLVELDDGGYRFQVELIRRWFSEQA